MVSSKTLVKAAVLLALSALLLAPAMAEDVDKKWRVSLSAGGFNPQDEVTSNAANVFVLLDPCVRTNTCTSADLITGALVDPRLDSSVFGNLDVNSGNLGTVAVQYGALKTGVANIIVEGSIGYHKADVGDIEVQAQFIGNGVEEDVQDQFNFNFLPYRVPAGEVTRVPIQLSAIARFRPRAKLNPYFGVGIGYSIIGFDSDPAFDELSRNMDASRGLQMRLTDSFQTGGNPTTVTDGLPQLDLDGATVDARDTFEWHAIGGLELGVASKWSIFLDVRWVDMSRSFSIGFNGSDELGISVPQFQDFDDTVLANSRFGPVLIGSCPVTEAGQQCAGGGLLDVGAVVLIEDESAPATVDCDTDPTNQFCIADFMFIDGGDGIPDPGQYYAQGGTVQYDGFALQFGIRFTF